MRTLLGALGVAVAVFFAGPASADDAPNPELLKKQLLEKFDANGDGNLTGQELQNAQEAMLKQFGAIAATIGNAPGREERLRSAIRLALDQYE